MPNVLRLRTNQETISDSQINRAQDSTLYKTEGGRDGGPGRLFVPLLLSKPPPHSAVDDSEHYFSSVGPIDGGKEGRRGAEGRMIAAVARGTSPTRGQDSDDKENWSADARASKWREGRG